MRDAFDILTKNIKTQTKGNTAIFDRNENSTNSGLSVYQNNFLFGLIDCLKNTFPSILFLLGDDNFKFFARKFIISNPGDQPDKNMYGLDFSEFIGQQQELSECFYLKEIGQLDRIWFLKEVGEQHLYSLGVLDLWQKINSLNIVKKVDIDQNKRERVFLINKNESWYFIGEIQG